MRALLAVCLSLLAAPTHADATQTFTSPDGVFQFRYPSVLVHCTQTKAVREGGWIPGDDCNSQDGICDDQGSSARTIACFAYPKDEFKGKPEFSAAAFFVAEVGAATTRESCLKGSQDWLIEKTEDATIHSVRMKRFTTSDSWTSGGQWGEIYRAFRGSTCYEFGIQWASTKAAAFDPGTIQQFTEQDFAKVSSALQRPIDSFEFLK